MSPRLCRCHGVPMRKDRRQWRCVIAQRETCRKASARYRQTANGQAHLVQNNARRLFIGDRFTGRVLSPDEGRRINALIQQQLATFLACQVCKQLARH